MKFKLLCKEYMVVCTVSYTSTQSKIAMIPILCIMLYMRCNVFLEPAVSLSVSLHCITNTHLLK